MTAKVTVPDSCRGIVELPSCRPLDLTPCTHRIDSAQLGHDTAEDPRSPGIWTPSTRSSTRYAAAGLHTVMQPYGTISRPASHPGWPSRLATPRSLPLRRSSTPTLGRPDAARPG
jgi:hypothetical protein